MDHHHHHHHGEEPLIKINVSHGPSQHEIFVPPNSTFGYVKKLIEEKTGVEPDRQKILFRGKEKEEDGEYLREAGVKDNSKILVLEGKKEKQVEEMLKDSEGTSTVKASEEGISLPETEAKDGEEKMSKAFRAIAETRVEVDKLAERVAALQVAVNGGTKVSEDEFAVSSELLMRQLLKLDGIEAEGEAKMERRAEVRRVQNFHEILDNLKARNSNPFLDNDNAMSVTTAWETFDSGEGSMSPPPTTPSSTRITQDWERFD